MQTILGRKLGMTQIFDDSGNVVPVTVIEAGPCPVLQKKTKEKDGYSAVQLGFDVVKAKALNKPEMGHVKKHAAQVMQELYDGSEDKGMRKLHEVRIEDVSAVGDVVKVGVFEVGQKVDVQGTSKGKGTAGVMKRHNFGGGRKSHGASLIHRMPASNGPVDPARTFKGKKRAGQMGNKTVSALGLTIAAIDNERNLMMIRGAVPGAKGGIVVVKTSVKG